MRHISTVFNVFRIPAFIRSAMLSLVAATRSSASLLAVDVAADFSYRVSLNGDRWLQSSPVRAYFEHREYGTPTKVGEVKASSGTDEIGAFSASTQQWRAGGVSFSTAVKLYPALDVAVFETAVPQGANGTNASVPVVPGDCWF